MHSAHASAHSSAICITYTIANTIAYAITDDCTYGGAFSSTDHKCPISFS